jgi:diphosphomevalonate decarboxylase
MTLAELSTQTTVSFDQKLSTDRFSLNQVEMTGASLQRVSRMLDNVRQLAGISTFARVDSVNNFPTSAGMASSASGFAALSLSATQAAGISLDEEALSRLARTGSGSACRSINGGFVEWLAGTDDSDSYAFSLASSDHWDIVDCIVLVSLDEKSTTSSAGHTLATTSILQPVRISDAPRRLDICRQAIINRNFTVLADIVELDSNLMHAVMITSHPALIYWEPATLAIMQAVRAWRNTGIPCAYTVDAGPNVHVICLAEDVERISTGLRQVPGVINVLTSHPGEGVRVINQ